MLFGEQAILEKSPFLQEVNRKKREGNRSYKGSDEECTGRPSSHREAHLKKGRPCRKEERRQKLYRVQQCKFVEEGDFFGTTRGPRLPPGEKN